MPQGGHISRVLSVLPKKLSKNPDILKKGYVFILFSLLIFLIQLCAPGFVGIDAYYHVKVSELMMQHGILKDFPWTQVSIWKDKFADKEFLFHVYLMPFLRVFPDLMVAGKVAISVLGGVLFCLFYRLLNQFQIRHALIWTLIAFGVNSNFLQRMCMIRPHVLSVLLILLFVESLWNRRLWKLLLISVLYPLAYTAAHFLVFITLIYVAILWIHQRELKMSFLLLTLVGITFGLVIHPQFPNNLKTWYVQNALLPVFNWGNNQEFWFVGEVKSQPISTFIGVNGITLFLWGIAMTFLILNRRNLSSISVFIFILASIFLVMTIVSMRFVEYWMPFTALSVALGITAISRLKSSVLKTGLKIGYVGLLSFSLVMYVLAMLLIPLRFPLKLEGSAHWLKVNTPEKAIIFTSNWSDFPVLFYLGLTQY